jgi:hypothetical protein
MLLCAARAVRGGRERLRRPFSRELAISGGTAALGAEERHDGDAEGYPMTTIALGIGSVLGGTLIRDSATGLWSWSDGSPAFEVRDLIMKDLAPSLGTPDKIGVIEIPLRWRDAFRWPDGVVNPDVAAAIQQLIDEHGKIVLIGWRIPIEVWDVTMRRVCGATWHISAAKTILRRAHELGWIQ